ncbi:gas vesicle protein [Actinocrinis puniceicyclus]|uniref:Gas vesicle protein n=1 Tax=Actinocrinis puniceicyclus TaxID=977794 RepID=A0A8J7WS16_9ACTN|nr:gas vesicle protein [Actinocrinis puniceicyclus]MBS2964937.1 gas vesicle protein [Actinocrinis puniceicyclus]
MTVTGPTNNQPAPTSSNLGDILERVLDKGLVIAGDIRVNLLDIELLTIKLRLVIASLETAKEVGIDWWESDPWLRGEEHGLAAENRRLRERVAALEEARENGGGRALARGRDWESGAGRDGEQAGLEAAKRGGGRHG